MANLLSLEQFRKIAQMNPYHFWQLVNDDVPLLRNCDDLLYEQDWMSSDAISRSAIREAISTAEAKLRDWLQYDVAPRYHDDTVWWPRRVNQAQWRGFDIGANDRSISLRLPYGQVQSVGAQTFALQSTPAIALSRSAYGTTPPDTFTATFSTSLTDASELRAYFAPADRWDTGIPLDDWEIAPVSFAISGGQCTVTGKAWQVVQPLLYSETGGRPVTYDPADPTIYVTSIAVYRVYIDPNGETVDTSQATLIWETNPAPYGWCYAASGTSPYTPNAADPAAVGKAVARVGIRDRAVGLVTPDQAVRDADTGEWRRVWWSTGYEPDRVQVRYLAGLPLVNGQMDRVWQETLTYLALAELPGPICACEGVSKRLHHWQFDLARTGGANDESYAISAEDLDNPLGTRRGHIYAWRKIKPLRTLIGFSF